MRSTALSGVWLRVAASGLCLAFAVGCQGQIVGSSPTQGSDVGGGGPGDGPGGGLGDPGGILPASEIGAVAVTCDPKATVSAEFAPLARLTRREYVNTLRDLLGVAVPIAKLQPDGISGLFYANVASGVSETQVDDYRLTAEEVAETATTDVATLVGCAPQTGEACARSFIESFGQRAFRRPLSIEEVESYLAVFRVGSGRDGFRGGIRLVVTGFLESPWLLYRVEQSPRSAAGVRRLSGFELATRLSYLITASTPDAVLLDAAARGGLDSAEGLRAQTERLLLTPAAQQAIGGFHGEWLKLSGIDEVEKDAALFPAFTAELKRAIEAETANFVGYVLSQGDGRFATLLTAPFSVIDPILAPIYGVPAPAGVAKVDFDPTQRSGLLTQAAFLAVKAHHQQSSPVRRGVGLLQSIACISLPPPPANVMAQAPEINPNATTRERFAAHSNNPTCAGCHSKIDPAGFAFEHYDALGQYRETENGQAIDTSVTVVNLADDLTGDYPDLRALLERLAQSKTASDCYTTQWFRYALKRDPVRRDACSLKNMLTAFEAGDGRVADLVRAVAGADAFRHGVKEAE